MQAQSTSHPVMKLRGVKVHNLQEISLDIPLHQIIAITGISGSGKSSLAFDTIFAEGQRTLLETLPSTSQAHLAQLERPQAVSLEGIPPAFMIRQRGADLDQKISIGDWTGLSQKLLNLFTKYGEPICSICSKNIAKHTLNSIHEHIKQLPDGTRFQLAFKVPVNKKSEIKSLTTQLNQAGFHRIHLTENHAILSISNQHAESTSLVAPKKPVTRSSISKQALIVITDRLVIGKTADDRLLESISLTLREGSGLIFLLTEPTSKSSTCIEIDNQSWQITPLFLGSYCITCNQKLSPAFLDSSNSQEQNPPAVDYSLAKLTFTDSLLEPLRSWPSEFLTYLQEKSAKSSISQLNSWINWLKKLHLAHLALKTPLKSLSTGEAQRLNLARAANLGIIHTMFVIDEPCAGTHPQERLAIYEVIKRLKDTGNSVIVVEHDPEILHLADQIIDLGPEAGTEGGKIVFQGDYPGLLNSSNSLTARWINKTTTESYANKTTHRWQSSPELTFISTKPQLSQIGLEIPLQRLVAITGHSGTGKRILLHRVIFDSICKSKNWTDKLADNDLCNEATSFAVSGLDQVDDCILMTGRPRKAHYAQTVITGLDLYTEIRQLFAKTHEAKMKGYNAGDFSFSSARGKKCHKCKGTGSVQLHFPQLPPQKSTCPTCHGDRFQPQMNEVLYRGLNISQTLNQTIDDAFQFFRNIPKLQKGLFALKEAGLGYLTLGRNLITLSGGEYQRYLIAQCINTGTGSRILFLFEEPSIGLHPENKHQLLKLFFHLLELGHSIIMLENDPLLTASCEEVIDLSI